MILRLRNTLTKPGLKVAAEHSSLNTFDMSSTYHKIDHGHVSVEFTSHNDSFIVTVDHPVDPQVRVFLDDGEWESLCAIIVDMNEFLAGPGPEVNLKKVEVKDGAMDVEIEAEEIVRFYAAHMKELFDSVQGADNYYTVTMRFAGDDKAYTLTFQRHHGKTPAEIADARISELEIELAKYNRTKLRTLVDNVWSHVTESEEVPSTITADKLIDNWLNT
jgi:hypothetical protein